MKAKNKLGFIERTLTKPKPKEGEDGGELNVWEMVNSMICSWIVNAIHPKLLASVAYVEAAQAMWGNLSKWYAIANTPKIHQLKINLASYKQGDSEVIEFYSKLMRM